jgi:hypothetical protein
MRYYKGDTIRTIRVMPYKMSAHVVVGERQRGVAEEFVYTPLKAGVLDIHRNMRYGTFTAAGPIGPDHTPLSMVDTLEVQTVCERPWYNHLRAAWDSIFKP